MLAFVESLNIILAKEATVKVADMTGPVFMNTIDKIVKDLNDPSLA